MEIPFFLSIPTDAIISPRRLCGPGKDGRERFRRNAGFHSATSKSWRAYWQGATVGTRPQRHVIVILFLLLFQIHFSLPAFLPFHTPGCWRVFLTRGSYRCQFYGVSHHDAHSSCLFSIHLVFPSTFFLSNHGAAWTVHLRHCCLSN